MSKKEVCSVHKKCGGCRYQGVPYEEQLKIKEKMVGRLMGKYCKIYPIVGMENPMHYRNKVHAVFDRDRKGNIISGVYREGTHQVIPVESCMIEDVLADEIIGTIRKLAKSFKIKTYDEDTGYGLLRHVLVKRAFATNQVMVVVVTGSPVFPSRNNFVKALLKEHPQITTIIHNINDKRTSMVLGEREKVLYGKGYIEDVLCGKKFRISAKSFYQVNPVQTEVLYRKAIEAVGFTGKEYVIDAYCGVGTIGMVASDYVDSVVGVELNRDAVRDAIGNAKVNDIKNIRFVCDDAGKFMVKLAAAAQRDKSVRLPDVVLMDPPRSGSDEAFLSALVKMGPKTVVYVSCNPVTLERDVKWLEKKGYKAKGVWPVDMFPFTEHVETIVLLSHKSPDSHINVKVEFGEGEGKIPLAAIAERAKKYQPKPKITYKMIQEYVEKKYGFKVHTAYVAEVKRNLGLTMYDAPNAVEELKQPRKHPPKEKVEAIKDALKYFGGI